MPYAASVATRGAPAYIRCIVAYYGDIGQLLPKLNDEQASKIPPILVAKAAKDEFIDNASIDAFVQAAQEKGVYVDLLTHPTGVHAFDLRNDDELSRDIIKKTIAFIREQLTA